MATTPRGYPYPLGTESADVPADIQAAVTAVDSDMSTLEAGFGVLGQFGTSHLTSDISYGNTKYTLLQFTAETSGEWFGGLTLPPTASSAWMTPGAGRWRITLNLSMPHFTNQSGLAYGYILKNVPGGTPYSNDTIPSSDKRLRLMPSPGGDGVELSATVTLGASDTITAMLYQGAGGSINLLSPTDSGWNSLRFERLG